MNCQLLIGIDWKRGRADRLVVFLPSGELTIDGVELAAAAEFLLINLVTGPSSRGALLQRASDTLSEKVAICKYAYDLLLRARVIIEQEGPLSEIECFYYFKDGDTKKIEDLKKANILLFCLDEDVADWVHAYKTLGMNVNIEISGPNSLPAALNDTKWNLVASVGPTFQHSFSRALNRIAVKGGIPVLFGMCGGLVARVGPTVFGRNLACLDCILARHSANGGGIKIDAIDDLHGDEVKDLVRPLCHPVLRQLLVQHVVLESVRILQNDAPLSFGGYLEFGYSGLALRREALKVPRCVGCSYNPPEHYPFDVTPLS